MRIKIDKKLREILLAVGPARQFVYPGLTDTKHFTRQQQKALFDNHIEKLPSFGQWIYSDALLKPIREPNHYRWRDHGQMQNIYRQILCDAPLHAPLKGRKPQSNLQITTAVEPSHWCDALHGAADEGRYEDVAILMRLDRKLAGGQLVITSGYREISGRLYADIQNLSKASRKRLFPGWHSYDISASMPTVIHGLYPEAVMIGEYIADKDRYRRHIAEVANTDYDTAKKIINGAIYGMTTHEKVIAWAVRYYPQMALVKMLGYDARRLIRDEWFVAFATQVRAALKHISDDVQRNSSRIDGKWHVTNTFGSKLILKRWNQAKVACHTYFGIERSIMAALDLPTSGVVMIHDGVITDHEITVPQTFKVGKELELSVKFVSEKL